jgi:hypothetical protein
MVRGQLALPDFTIGVIGKDHRGHAISEKVEFVVPRSMSQTRMGLRDFNGLSLSCLNITLFFIIGVLCYWFTITVLKISVLRCSPLAQLLQFQGFKNFFAPLGPEPGRIST